MDLFLMHTFVTACIGHLENIHSLRHPVLLNVDTLHYTISKSTLTNITSNLIRKVFVSSSCDTHMFSQILLFIYKLELYSIGTNTDTFP